MKYHTRSNAHTQILRTVKDFSRILCSWTRHRRNGVRFPKYPHSCPSRLRYSGPTFHFWARWLVSWVVELGKAEAQAFRVLSSRSFWPLASKPRTVFASNRFSSYPEVELGLTEPTSISTNIRTTCSKSLAVFVSNDSALSVRPRILNLIFL